MNKLSTYFVIYSEHSRNSCGGLKPKVMWVFEKNIIEAADHELTKSGESLFDLAGIEWVETNEDGDMEPARPLTDEEELNLSIGKLNDDGRLYITFPTDESGTAAFIEAAEEYCLEDKAREIVEKFNS